MIESFFCILKSKIFYAYEKDYNSLEDLEQAVTHFIDYYNNNRIKVKQKDLVLCNTELSPLESQRKTRHGVKRI
ncbi:hypothetical protein DIX58_04585 [Streptococcus iniae]|nr:hypothetical protein DIX58_04585 [Streptococcus iniae]